VPELMQSGTAARADPLGCNEPGSGVRYVTSEATHLKCATRRRFRVGPSFVGVRGTPHRISGATQAPPAFKETHCSKIKSDSGLLALRNPSTSRGCSEPARVGAWVIYSDCLCPARPGNPVTTAGRESHCRGYWIPAFAGMTAAGERMVCFTAFVMLSLSACALRQQ
jgi:hypothetical protein